MNRPQKQATASRPSILRRFCKDGQAVACIFPSPQTHLPPHPAAPAPAKPPPRPLQVSTWQQNSRPRLPHRLHRHVFRPLLHQNALLRAKRGTGGGQAPDIQRIANNPLRKKRRGLYVSGSVSAACLPPSCCPHTGQAPLSPQARPATTGRGGGPLPGAHRSRPCCSRRFYFKKVVILSIIRIDGEAEIPRGRLGRG